jgi:hypothetical protein
VALELPSPKRLTLWECTVPTTFISKGQVTLTKRIHHVLQQLLG